MHIFEVPCTRVAIHIHEYPAFPLNAAFRRWQGRFAVSRSVSPTSSRTWCVGATKATAALHIVERLWADLAMLERSDAL